MQLSNKAVVEALDGLPYVKIHCSVLAEEAVKLAIIDYYKKIGRDTSFIEDKCSLECSNCISCEKNII